jgi:DNA-binding NtrC family response regulator
LLLTGETGTGKDEAARAIHAAGSRAAGPFVPINCAGIVGTLAESLLFGHEKGSFTGADDSAIGAFRAAHGGILLLVAHFTTDCARRFERPGWTLPDAAIRRFMDHSWPGNVRELRQTILRIAIFEDRLDEILDEMEAQRPAVPPAAASPPQAPPASPDTFNLDELRRDAVRRALAATAGHYGRAAALLGVSAKTMTKLVAKACPGTVAKRGRRRRKPLPR